MLKWNWSKVCIDYIARLLSQFSNPGCELFWISNSGRQKYVSNIAGQHNDCLFPNNASFFVSHIMNLIENYPFDLSDNLRTSVNHISENLGCHN